MDVLTARVLDQLELGIITRVEAKAQLATIMQQAQQAAWLAQQSHQAMQALQGWWWLGKEEQGMGHDDTLQAPQHPIP